MRQWLGGPRGPVLLYSTHRSRLDKTPQGMLQGEIPPGQMALGKKKKLKVEHCDDFNYADSYKVV